MNWAQRIADAEKRGYFGSEDVPLASKFETCAVGEITGAAGIPEDEILADYGEKFLWAINVDSFYNAKRYMRGIRRHIAGESPWPTRKSLT